MFIEEEIFVSVNLFFCFCKIRKANKLVEINGFFLFCKDWVFFLIVVSSIIFLCFFKEG